MLYSIIHIEDGGGQHNDVGRGKLALYESWGFPELWVEVPDTPRRADLRDCGPG